jgi:hypothetical protein
MRDGRGICSRLRAVLWLVALLACVIAEPAAAIRLNLAPGGWPSLGPAGLDATGGPLDTGRIQDLAADPSHPGRLLAMSDAALWRSDDDGHHWQKLSGLDRFGQWDFEEGGRLLYDPVNRDRVFAVSPRDDRSPSEAGIYVSNDGGISWRQASLGFRPPCGGAVTDLVASGEDVYAAGGCAIGFSGNGESFFWQEISSAGGLSGVAVDRAGNAYACGSAGLFEKTPGEQWQVVVRFNDPLWTLGDPVSNCRVTPSPVDAEHVFFSARWRNLNFGPYTNGFAAVIEAYRDGHRGWVWQDLRGPAHNNGRDVVIETRPAQAGSTNHAFDLFWHSTDLVFWSPCGGGPGFECQPGIDNDETHLTPAGFGDPPWLPVRPDGPLHPDASRILFDSSSPYCIHLIADDGGIQRPAPGNCSGEQRAAWSDSNNGLSTVEPHDAPLTSLLGGQPLTDLYLGLQDNGAFMWLAGESGWRQAVRESDGFGLAAAPFSRASGVATHLVSVLTIYNGNDRMFEGGRGLAGLTAAFGAPFAVDDGLGRGPEHQLDELPDGQLVLAVATGGKKQTATHIYTPGGGDWSLVDSVPAPKVQRGGPIILFATQTKLGTTLFLRAQGALTRLTASGVATPLLSGFDVGKFAAGPDGRHLLAFACPAGRCSRAGVYVSANGGSSWSATPLLTQLMRTDAFGNTGYADPDWANAGSGDVQVQSVAVGPPIGGRTPVLAVGTKDLGLFLSCDGGITWERESLIAPRIDNLHFDAWGRLYAGSYGRGLFGGQVPSCSAGRTLSSVLESLVGLVSRR